MIKKNRSDFKESVSTTRKASFSRILRTIQQVTSAGVVWNTVVQLGSKGNKDIVTIRGDRLADLALASMSSKVGDSARTGLVR